MPKSVALCAPASRSSNLPAATRASPSPSSLQPGAIPSRSRCRRPCHWSGVKYWLAFGANVILTEGSKGMAGAIQKAQETVQSAPDRYVLLQQFDNPANPEIHFK